MFVSDGYLCGITLQNDNKLLNLIYRLLYLYIPVWLAFIYNTIVLSKVVVYVKKVFNTNINESRSFQKLKFYPLVLFICYSGATIHEVYVYFYDE